MASDNSPIYMDRKKNVEMKRSLMQKKSEIHNDYIFKYTSYTPYIGDEYCSGKVLYVIGDLYIGEINFPKKKVREYPSDNFCSKIMSYCRYSEATIKKEIPKSNRKPCDGRTQKRIDIGVFTKIQDDIRNRKLDVTNVAFYTFYFDKYGKMGNSEGESGENLEKRKEALTVVIKELKPKEIVILGRVNAFIKGRLKTQKKACIYDGKSFDDFVKDNGIEVKELNLKNLKKSNEKKESGVIEAMDSFNGYFKKMDECFFSPIENNFAHIWKLFQILNKESIKEISKTSFVDLANIIQLLEILSTVSSQEIDKLSMHELIQICNDESLIDAPLKKNEQRIKAQNIISDKLKSFFDGKLELRRFPGLGAFAVGILETIVTSKGRNSRDFDQIIKKINDDSLKRYLQELVRKKFEDLSKSSFSQIKRIAKNIKPGSFKNELDARDYFTKKMNLSIDAFSLFMIVKKMRYETNRVRNEGTDYDYMVMLDLLERNNLFVSKKSVPLVLRYIYENLGDVISSLEYKSDIILDINDYLKDNQNLGFDCNNNLENVYLRFKNYEKENKTKYNKLEESDVQKNKYTELMTERIFEPNSDVNKLVKEEDLKKCCKHKWLPKYSRLKKGPKMSDHEMLMDLYNRKGLPRQHIW